MTRKRRPKVAGDEVSRPSRASEEFARGRRRAEVAERYLRGQPQSVIAEEMKISTGTVGGDLKWVTHKWLEDSKLAFEERKAKELAKIDHVELLAYRGWEKSIEKQEVHRSQKETVRQGIRNSENKIIGHKMVPVKVVEETVVKGQSGDPRFLEMIGRCVEMRLRILGLWKGDQLVQNQVLIDWAGLFRAQAEEAARRADDQRSKELGYKVLPPRAVVEVRAETSALEETNVRGNDPDVRRAGTPVPGAGACPGEQHDPDEAGGGTKESTNQSTPYGFPPEDPIEARLRAEELSLGIRLPEEPT